jgi:hypothetical protein
MQRDQVIEAVRAGREPAPDYLRAEERELIFRKAVSGVWQPALGTTREGDTPMKSLRPKLVVSSILLLSVLGIVLGATLRPSSPPATRSTSPTNHAVGRSTSTVAECMPGDLSQGVNMVDLGMHEWVVAFKLTNASGVSCSLAGYPKVTMVNQQSGQVDNGASQTSENEPALFGPGFEPSSGTADPAVLSPNAVAIVYLSTNTISSASCTGSEEPELSFAGWNSSVAAGEGIPICQGGSFVASAVGLEGSALFPTPVGPTPSSTTASNAPSNQSRPKLPKQ